MIERREGQIIYVSSVQGKIAVPFRSACKLSRSNLSSHGHQQRIVINFKKCFTLPRNHEIPVLDAASKHACQGFYDSLRAEVAQHNIKVFVVSPGYVRTNLSFNALDSDGSRHGGKRYIACDNSYKLV